MMNKAVLHPLKDVLTVGEPIKNPGALAAAIAHARGQAEGGHYKEMITDVSDTTDPATGVITRSVSWTMTPTDPKAKAAPAPALPAH